MLGRRPSYLKIVKFLCNECVCGALCMLIIAYFLCVLYVAPSFPVPLVMAEESVWVKASLCQVRYANCSVVIERTRSFWK